MKNKFTVITPCFNAEEFIEDTLLSVLNNKAVVNKDIELEYIICDGASTDQTIPIIEKIFNQPAYNHIQLELQSKKDSGMYSALAAGLRRASGSTISYLNAGDLYSPHAFEIINTVLEYYKFGIDESYMNSRKYFVINDKIYFESEPYHDSLFIAIEGDTVNNSDILFFAYEYALLKSVLDSTWDFVELHSDFVRRHDLISRFNIKTDKSKSFLNILSGGNQQKVVLARELSADPDVLIAMQPTRGLDVGSTKYVHETILKHRKKGKGILLISTELDEIIALSDRVAVIYEGRIMGILSQKDGFNLKKISLMMAGVTGSSDNNKVLETGNV